jgi:uncharacterized membrane protein YbhN (UPF0104 family)
VASVWLLARASASPGLLLAAQQHVRRLAAKPKISRTGDHSPSARSWAAIALPPRDWGAVTVLAVLNWSADGAVLAVSLAAVGAHVRWSALVLAYALSQVATLLPVLPGSLGVAEGSLVVVLVCAGVRSPDAFAATLVYRLASFWLQLPLGWVAWERLRHVRPFGPGGCEEGAVPRLVVPA